MQLGDRRANFVACGPGSNNTVLIELRFIFTLGLYCRLSCIISLSSYSVFYVRGVALLLRILLATSFLTLQAWCSFASWRLSPSLCCKHLQLQTLQPIEPSSWRFLSSRFTSHLKPSRVAIVWSRGTRCGQLLLRTMADLSVLRDCVSATEQNTGLLA